MHDLAAALANLSSVFDGAGTVGRFKPYSVYGGYRIIFPSVWTLGGKRERLLDDHMMITMYIRLYVHMYHPTDTPYKSDLPMMRVLHQ